jgi:hypothetical protein
VEEEGVWGVAEGAWLDMMSMVIGAGFGDIHYSLAEYGRRHLSLLLLLLYTWSAHIIRMS